jgi:hypothetical protein
MPVTGGPAETIFDLPARSEFVCPTRAPAASDCVLARFTDGSVSLESFNWKTGERQRLADIQNGSKAGSFPWMVSPDASQVATAEGNHVRVVDLKGGRSRIVGESAGTPTGICPGLETNEWIIATASSRENVLAAVGPSGTRKLWSSSRVIGSPLLAPDGKRLLLQISTATSNAWMIEIR